MDDGLRREFEEIMSSTSGTQPVAKIPQDSGMIVTNESKKSHFGNIFKLVIIGGVVILLLMCTLGNRMQIQEPRDQYNYNYDFNREVGADKDEEEEENDPLFQRFADD